jgi:hypothetical protein
MWTPGFCAGLRTDSGTPRTTESQLHPRYITMRFTDVTLHAAIIVGATALDNGVGKLPALGYNSEF